MNEIWPGRRGALLGALAATAMGAAAGRAGAMTAPISGSVEEAPEYLDFDLMLREAEEEADEHHAPFRAEFLAWFQEASARFVLPVSVDADTPSTTRLHVPGLASAVSIVLSGDTDINIYVQWKDVFWDIVASMDVYPSMAADGSGWVNGWFVPEAQHPYATREACWREDGFEHLLQWVNASLATSTHLALLSGGKSSWTEAGLVRDGRMTRTGRPISAEFLRHLLQLHSAGTAGADDAGMVS